MERSYYNRVPYRPLAWIDTSKEVNRIMDVLRPHAFGKVLDVGCGGGFFTNKIAKLPGVEEIVGVDISEAAIDIAKNKYPHISFQVDSVTKLSFESNYFDLVCALEVVEHIIDIEQMFKEFNRVLKKGRGHLVITTPDFSSLLKRIVILGFLFEKNIPPSNPHIRFFTKQNLSAELNHCGFELVNYKWNGSYHGLWAKGQIVLAQKVRERGD